MNVWLRERGEEKYEWIQEKKLHMFSASIVGTSIE